MLSLRPTRRLCNFSSAAAAAAITTESIAATPKSKPLLSPALDRLKSEHNPDNLFHIFNANATNPILVENRFAFDDTVSRLAGARRFDYIERLLDHQLHLPQGRREGFVVRIIKLYGKAGMTQQAIDTFYRMHLFGCRRTVKSFNAALLVLSTTKNYDYFVDFLETATQSFDIQVDIYSVNIAIKAFCDMGKLQQAYLFMLQVENRGLNPDSVTYTTLLSAFYRNKRWEIGTGLWNRMVLKGLMPSLATFNVRVQFLVCMRRAWDANDTMALMRRVGIAPDEATYNMVIKGFCRAGFIDMAKKVYDAFLEERHKPNSKIYQTMIHYLCKSGDFDQAYTMCKDSMQKNWFPNVDTICMLLKILKGTGQINRAKTILVLVRRRKPPFSSDHLSAMESMLKS
ncbi:hypothetical protein PIB30_021356 [Stylosanthes scabra]|uniref:Pentatricopeptide repeat-containing protein n=1 Tax=Stylosanthes scabra TaxID=79078 RepID=A0ABU6R949_9FABA|nr:hypothetical protein [Stylosanthes scabra]